MVEYPTISEVTSQPARVTISVESWIIGLICIADMVSTILLVRSGRAIEANPILRPYMDRGIGCFMLAKSLFFIAPLFALELLRVRRPQFVKFMLRAGIVLYLCVYSFGVYQLNHEKPQPPVQMADRNVNS